MTDQYAGFDTQIAAPGGDIICLGGNTAIVDDAQQARVNSPSYHL